MPPLGPNEGEKTECREGDDSACRKEGVGGTTSVTFSEKDLSNPGVRMVRPAGLRRPVLGGITGEGGAEKWCDVVSTMGAVAISGRDESKGGGILSDKFLRLRARRLGDSGCTGLEVSDGFNDSFRCCDCGCAGCAGFCLRECAGCMN